MRQGCILSPDMFSLYALAVIEKLENMVGYIRIRRFNINNIRYAYDTVLIADKEENFQMIVDSLSECCERYGLKSNVGIAEVMGLTKRREQLPFNIRLRGETQNQVSSFKHFVSLVKDDGRCDSDIKVRIGTAKTAIGQLRKIMVSLYQLRQ